MFSQWRRSDGRSMVRRALQAPKPLEADQLPPASTAAVQAQALTSAPSLDHDEADDDDAPPPPAKKQRKSAPVVVQKVNEATVVAKDGVTRLTLRLHQEFATRAEVRDLIHDFALAQGKRAVEDKRYSGGNRFNYVCNSKTPCEFIVRGFKSQRKGLSRYVLKAFNIDHSDECTGKPAITQRQVLDQIKMASSLINSSASAASSLSRAEVQSLVKTVYGTDVPLRMAYRAKGALDGHVVKDATLEIQQLESLLTQFQTLNATSAIHVDTDEASSEDAGERTFHRAFLKLPYADYIQKHSMRVLGLDGMEVGRNSSLHGGYLIELVARDGNNDSYILAVALCEGGASKPASSGAVQQTAETFAWFLNCCRSSGITFDVPMFCDRSAELLQAAEQVLPSGGGLLVQCTQHLIDKVSKMLKVTFTKDMLTCVWRAQAADTQTEFDEILDELSTKHNKRVGDYLSSLDPHTWAKCCFLNKYPLYNWQTTTLGESENPETLAARERGPIEFFQSYFERAMHALYARKSDAHKWLKASQTSSGSVGGLQDNKLLTSFAQEALEDQRQRAASCCVTPSDGDTGSAYVWDTKDRVPKKKRVNVSMNSCSCLYSGQMGLPCKHLVAAVQFFNNRGNAWSLARLCDKVYSVDNYFKAYGNVTGIEMPVEEELVRNTTLGVKQMGSRRCSVCDAYGHNKRNCTKNITSRSFSGSEALI